MDRDREQPGESLRRGIADAEQGRVKRLDWLTDRPVANWSKYDRSTNTELRLRFADGGATFTLGSPDGPKLETISFDAVELTRLTQLLVAVCPTAVRVPVDQPVTMNVHVQPLASNLPPHAIRSAVHIEPRGDLVFWVETPLLVHRARCPKIGPYTGVLMNAERLTNFLGTTKFDVTTCVECAPFGRLTQLGALPIAWIYDPDQLNEAAHRLNIVAASEMIRKPAEVDEAVADARRAAAHDGDEPSQPI